MKNNRPFRMRLILATIIRKARILILKTKGYRIPYSVIIERSVTLDKLNPRGIDIGDYTLVGAGVTILSHDHCKRTAGNAPLFTNTSIGKSCFIAIGAIILPGVKIGDEVVVGAGSVVTKDVPSNCVVAGNPARVIRENIVMNNFAAVVNWNEDIGWY